MEEKEITIESALSTMSEALKQYEEGKYDTAEHTRKLANEMFDKVSSKMSTEEGRDDMMYGECRNFGMLYKILESNTKLMYESEEGRKSIAKIARLIKSNPVLLSEFKTYNTYLNPVNVTDAKEYVSEAIKLSEKHSKKELKVNNQIMLDTIRGEGLEENVNFDEDEIAVYEAIENTISSKPKIENVNSHINTLNLLSECVAERNITKDNKTASERLSEAYRAISEKYADVINEDEIKLVEKIATQPDKGESMFNKYRKEILERVEKEIVTSEGVDKEGWKQVRENVEKKTFNPKNAVVDIAEMIEIGNTLK